MVELEPFQSYSNNNMSKWLKTLNRINATRYQIPAGWQTREQVAVELQCDPDRVADLLKPGLQSGDFERKEFPVWDSARRMTVRVVCYRVCDASSQKTAAPSSPAAPAVKGSSVSDERIAAAILRDPTRDDGKVSRAIGVRVAEVRRVRASLAR